MKFPLTVLFPVFFHRSVLTSIINVIADSNTYLGVMHTICFHVITMQSCIWNLAYEYRNCLIYSQLIINYLSELGVIIKICFINLTGSEKRIIAVL